MLKPRPFYKLYMIRHPFDHESLEIVQPAEPMTYIQCDKLHVFQAQCTCVCLECYRSPFPGLMASWHGRLHIGHSVFVPTRTLIADPPRPVPLGLLGHGAGEGHQALPMGYPPPCDGGGRRRGSLIEHRERSSNHQHNFMKVIHSQSFPDLSVLGEENKHRAS